MILDTSAPSALLEGDRALESLLGDQLHHELPVIVIPRDPSCTDNRRHRP